MFDRIGILEATGHTGRCAVFAAAACIWRIARSTYYDHPEKPADDIAILEAMFRICDEFEFYGYRRVGAALRQHCREPQENPTPDARA